MQPGPIKDSNNKHQFPFTLLEKDDFVVAMFWAASFMTTIGKLLDSRSDMVFQPFRLVVSVVTSPAMASGTFLSWVPRAGLPCCLTLFIRLTSLSNYPSLSPVCTKL